MQPDNVVPLLELVDRCFVINLPERTDRRSEITAQLAQVGLLDTSRPDSGKVEFFRAIRPSTPAGFPSVGARGAFLSHLEVLRVSVARGYRAVLVLEDDVLFTRAFRAGQGRIAALLACRPWDLVQLGYYTLEGGFDPFHSDEPGLIAFEGEVLGAHCYLVHGAHMPRLVEFLVGLSEGPVGDHLRGPMPIDGAFNVVKWRFPAMNRLLAVPVFAIQRSSRSDITPGFLDRLPGTRQLLAVARRYGFVTRVRRLCERLIRR